jgi:hypothetical protein
MGHFLERDGMHVHCTYYQRATCQETRSGSRGLVPQAPQLLSQRHSVKLTGAFTDRRDGVLAPLVMHWHLRRPSSPRFTPETGPPCRPEEGPLLCL